MLPIENEYLENNSIFNHNYYLLLTKVADTLESKCEAWKDIANKMKITLWRSVCDSLVDACNKMLRVFSHILIGTCPVVTLKP